MTNTKKRSVAGGFVEQIDGLQKDREGYVSLLSLERIIKTMERVCAHKEKGTDDKYCDPCLRFSFDDGSMILIANPNQYADPAFAIEVH